MFSFFSKVPTISTQEFATKLTTTGEVLDVRTPAEYRAGHIRQAKNVPLQQIAQYQPKAQPIYVICQSGMRSKQAAKQLQKKGYNVINVRGGMNQWTGKRVGGK